MVVGKSYTAGQTAEAIISHAGSGLFPDSLGVAFRRDKYGRTGDLDVILEWRRSAVGEAAEYAAMMAELYYGTLGGLSASGDLVLTIDEIQRDGFRFHQLLAALPMLGVVVKRIKRLLLKLPGGEVVELPGRLLEKLNALSPASRKSVVESAQAAKTSDEALDRIHQAVGVARNAVRQVHHPISAKVHAALEKHSILKGRYQKRDRRFELLASSNEAHRGYQDWHIRLDDEVSTWIRKNDKATQESFEKWLRWRYEQPDLKWRFERWL
jgi:hypothetical protein